MYYIVGLGNPGDKYEGTRHNAGMAALRMVAERAGLPAWVESSKYSGLTTGGMLQQEETQLLLPSTFMNNSGTAVRKLVPKGSEKQLIVLYDDVDLPVGECKVSVGRGSGGHNGVSSIISSLGTKDFIRVRIGIARKGFWSGKPVRPQGGADMNTHVLGKFTKGEQATLEGVYTTVYDIVRDIVEKGVEVTMNTHN